MAYRDVNYSLQRNPLVLPALLLAAGIAAGSELVSEPWMVAVVLVGIVAAAFMVKNPMHQTKLLYLCVFVLGMLLSSVADPKEHSLSESNAVQQWVDVQYEKSGVRNHKLLAAMTTGKTVDTRSVVSEVRHDYSTAGVAHLLALSGLHVGLFYAVVLFLFMRRRHSAVVQIIVLSSVWIYVLLTGAAASTVRAGIMVTLHALSLMLYREPLPFNQLALAALLILVVSPLDLFDVGFIMSFGAVISIFMYSPLIMLKVENKIVRWLCATVCISVSAQIGVAPVLAYVFGQISPYFLISNLVIVPTAMVVIYGAAVILLLAPIPVMQAFVARNVSVVLDEMDRFIHYIAHLPGAEAHVEINMVQTICCYVIIVAVAFLIKVIRD